MSPETKKREDRRIEALARSSGLPHICRWTPFKEDDWQWCYEPGYAGSFEKDAKASEFCNRLNNAATS